MGLDVEARADSLAGQGMEAQPSRPAERTSVALAEEAVAGGEPGAAPAAVAPASELRAGFLADSLERHPLRREPEAMRRTWISGLFVDALARDRRAGGRRPDRPRMAAFAAGTIVCLVVSAGLAVWPAVSHQLGRGRVAVRVASRPVTHTTTGQGAQAGTRMGQAGTGTATGGGTVTAPVQDVPSSTGSSQTQPVAGQPTVDQPPAGTTTTTGNPPPATSVNQPQLQSQSAPAPPPVTFASTEMIDLGSPTFARTGTWNTYPRGGDPNFSSSIIWTGDQSATATWSLGNPGGGQRWDQTRVRVWIPDPLGGAVVRYTVHYPTFDAPNSQTFDVAQETTNNWHELGVFNIGTATRRTGSIWVVMTYVRPYPNPSDPACPNGSCWSMGASGVEFGWS